MSTAQREEEALFDAARRLAQPGQREAFLDQACDGDPELRERVERLLAADSDADRFFAEGKSAFRFPADPPAEEGAVDPGLAAEEPASRHIGRYKLLQKIGEGGCGSVYMAEQEEPVRRRVALKVIKLGMDTRAVIARFEAERQALAMMDHPNISRVLEAGATEAGRPYFVMELVRGVKITTYCDEHHLDTRSRLDLFVQICHAIQHAHQKGIIHRDIKPSNILVTLHDGVPVPKVIDFGIAKATEARLTDKTLFTAYEQFIGTPAYMSPEQAEMSGLDIDTRSDIYSLGVLLYELLTGKTPFDQKELLQSGIDEMRRTLREREPHRPSTKLDTLKQEELTATAEHRQAEPPKLQSQLRGDLDWIVMKALEKDRRRRYETANGLAMDIRRHLDNEPVIARPPSRLYRFEKLVRRNRGVFAAASAVAATLLLGLGTSTWLFLGEREARQRAVEAEQQQARLRAEAERGRANEAVLRHQAEARTRITQAAALLAQDRTNDADQVLGELPFSQPTLEGAEVFRTLGDWHAIHGRWRRAADCFTVLLRANQSDNRDITSIDYLRAGPIWLELQDAAQYEIFRQATLANFAHTADPVVAERAIKICLLGPPDAKLLASLTPLVGLAEREFLNAGDTSKFGDFQVAWATMALALLECRRGDSAKAIALTQRTINSPGYNAPRQATARVILSLALRQAGRAAEAADELRQAREFIEGKFLAGLDLGSAEQGFWFDWVFARVLLREATAK